MFGCLWTGPKMSDILSDMSDKAAALQAPGLLRRLSYKCGQKSFTQ